MLVLMAVVFIGKSLDVEKRSIRSFKNPGFSGSEIKCDNVTEFQRLRRTVYFDGNRHCVRFFGIGKADLIRKRFVGVSIIAFYAVGNDKGTCRGLAQTVIICIGKAKFTICRIDFFVCLIFNGSGFNIVSIRDIRIFFYPELHRVRSVRVSDFLNVLQTGYSVGLLRYSISINAGA